MNNLDLRAIIGHTSGKNMPAGWKQGYLIQLQLRSRYTFHVMDNIEHFNQNQFHTLEKKDAKT